MLRKVKGRHHTKSILFHLFSLHRSLSPPKIPEDVSSHLIRVAAKPALDVLEDLWRRKNQFSKHEQYAIDLCFAYPSKG